MGLGDVMDTHITETFLPNVKDSTFIVLFHYKQSGCHLKELCWMKVATATAVQHLESVFTISQLWTP